MKKVNMLWAPVQGMVLYRNYLIYIVYDEDEGRYWTAVYNMSGEMVWEIDGEDDYEDTLAGAKNEVNDHLEIGGNYYEE